MIRLVKHLTGEYLTWGTYETPTYETAFGLGTDEPDGYGRVVGVWARRHGKGVFFGVWRNA